MNTKYEDCVKSCMECLEACNTCFDEEHLKILVDCIRLDCAGVDVCAFAVKAMTSNSTFVKEICKLCAEACRKMSM